MNRVEFSRLVRDVEARFENRTAELAAATFRYARGGYAYLFMVGLASLIALVLIVWFVITTPSGASLKLGLLAGSLALALCWSVAKGVRVPMEAPEGLAVTRDTAPELFALLDDLGRRVAAIRFDRVLVDGDFNAGVVQVPRLGIFGWYRSYLLLGLPLMQSLRPDEFRAVLAHEFAHLGTQDGKTGSWLYRTRRSWQKVIEAMAGEGSFALTPFLKWFWPRFDAHAFVLSRLHEYRADATAADYAGKAAVGNALQRVELRARHFGETVWPALLRRVSDERTIPRDMFEQVGRGMRTAIEPSREKTWMEQALARLTDHTDTHPALSDRLGAVGVQPGAPLPAVDRTAAEEFLGELETGLARKLSHAVAEAMAPAWTEKHERINELRTQLGEEKDVDNAEKAWNWAAAMAEIEGDEAALPWVEKVLEYDASHVGARFVDARIRLEKGHLAAIGDLEQLLDEDPTIGLPVLGVLRAHYANTGQPDGLAEIDRRADRLEEDLERAQAERHAVYAADELVPAELTDEQLAACRRAIDAEKGVADAYIVRKATKHLTHLPMFVICVRLHWSKDSSEVVVQRILEALDLPGTVYVFTTEQLKVVAKAVRSVEGAVFYSRRSK